MTGRRRVLLYCQHLTGTGHFVRMFEIARVLAEAHDVFLIDGGRPVPRPVVPGRPAPTLVPLPRIVRGPSGLMPLEPGGDIGQIVRRRQSELLALVERLAPDVLIVEHFPFTKWELREEIVTAIDRVRAVNPKARVVCSLRDVSPATRYDVRGDDYRRRVLDVLHTRFDLLLVHSDPNLIALDESVPWARDIRTPLEYTGYIAEENRDGSYFSDTSIRPRSVVASVGGTGDPALFSEIHEGWRQFTTRHSDAGRTLVVFLPLAKNNSRPYYWGCAATAPNVRVLPFSMDFLAWMQQADLSISAAGYNTCANLLRTRCRAILVPDPAMSDQPLRVRRFAERGLATVIQRSDLTAPRLADAIAQALAAPAPQHDVDLTGSQTTRAILERW